MPWWVLQQNVGAEKAYNKLVLKVAIIHLFDWLVQWDLFDGLMKPGNAILLFWNVQNGEKRRYGDLLDSIQNDLNPSTWLSLLQVW